MEGKGNVNRSSGRRGMTGAGKVLLVLLLMFVSLFALMAIYVNDKLNLINYINKDEIWSYTSSADMDDFDDPGIEAADPNAEIDLPETDIFKDKDVMNILLLGTDERVDNLSEYARSDAMLILSLNRKTNSVKLVSLERGMNIIMPNGEIDVLTNAFRYGGPDWIIACVQSHLKVDVDKYIRVNFDVFEKIVDAVGGVDIELSRIEAAALNLEVHTNTLALDERVHEGMNHLDGFATLQYCRLRYTDSDWVRIVRQRKTIAAIKDQCKDLSIGELNELADQVLPMVQTNLSKTEILRLMLKLPQFLKSDIEDMTIPAEGTFERLSNVDFEANSRILQEFFYGDTE